MTTGRGIDVIAVILVAVLILEGVAIFLAQCSVWPHDQWVAVRAFGGRLPLGSSLWLPGTIAAGAALFSLEAVMRRRSEQAVFTRVVVSLVIAVGLVIAVVLGFATGAAYVTRPVG